MIYGLLGNNSVKENNNWKHPTQRIDFVDGYPSSGILQDTWLSFAIPS